MLQTKFMENSIHPSSIFRVWSNEILHNSQVIYSFDQIKVNWWKYVWHFWCSYIYMNPNEGSSVNTILIEYRIYKVYTLKINRFIYIYQYITGCLSIQWISHVLIRLSKSSQITKAIGRTQFVSITGLLLPYDDIPCLFSRFVFFKCYHHTHNTLSSVKFQIGNSGNIRPKHH